MIAFNRCPGCRPMRATIQPTNESERVYLAGERLGRTNIPEKLGKALIYVAFELAAVTNEEPSYYLNRAVDELEMGRDAKVIIRELVYAINAKGA